MSLVCFNFDLTVSLSSGLHLMTWDIISTSKLRVNSGADVVGVAAVDVLVTLDWVDSSCLFSDITLE